MKLQVTQENLSKALGTVARVANARNSLPVLANVLIKTVDNRLSVAATNLEIAITHYIGSKVAEPGAITVPARLTQDFVASLPSGIINLQLDEHKLHITTNQYQSVINGVSAEEFPVMPTIEGGQQFTLPAKDLRKALQQTIIAASGDEARPVLTGIYTHTHEGKLYLAATDSYRLAEKQIGPIDQELKMLVPVVAMQDLLRIMPDQDTEVRVQYDEQQVRFMCGEIELVTRLIEGSYPDYRKLIPQKFATTASLKREDFVNITKVSSLFARESAGSVTLRVGDDQVSIRSIASQLGENTSTAEAKVEGAGEVTLNSRYLLDALNAFHGDMITFCINGKLEPCVLKSDDAPDYVHIVMPLKS